MEALDYVESVVRRVKMDSLDLQGRAQMDHQDLKVRKDNLAHREMMDLRESQEKKVISVMLAQYPLEDPQGILALLVFLVKMDLLDHPVQLGQKVILVLQEVMEQVEILEIRVSRASLEILALQALKEKRDKFSVSKVPKVRKVNRVLRDFQETKVLTENKVILGTMALLDQQALQETRVNQAVMDRMEVLGQKVIKVMKV